MTDPGGAFHRFPQPAHIDAVRWLPSASAFDRFVAAAVHNPDTATSSLQIHALDLSPAAPVLLLRSSHPSPSRISSLRVAPNLAAFATFAGSLHILSISPDFTFKSDLSLAELHSGPVAGVDVQADGMGVRDGGGGRAGEFGEGWAGEAGEGDGVRQPWAGVVYRGAWASPAEFATGGLGFGLQWWDRRKPGGLVAQLKGDWARGCVTGMVHSIDIQPSRKHICMVGGSSGTILAWDLRWQQQPIVFSAVGLNGISQPTVESEVWEVQYDSHSQSSSIISAAPSSKISPVMICSEDGIVAVLEQDEEPLELLAEPCAINALDISPQNPSDVVCGLEWETIGILMRSRDAMIAY